MGSPTAASRSLPRFFVVAAAFVLAACSGGGGTTQAPVSAAAPGSSGASGAPCPAAPAPADLPDWRPPATTPAVLPVPVSSQLVCGPNRFVFSFLDAKNSPIATPTRSATVAFYDLGRDPKKPVATKSGAFVWAIEGSRGVYVTSMDFTESGVWGAEFTTAEGAASPSVGRLTFTVLARGQTLPVGAKAPASVTPTLASVGGDIAQLSTDSKPDRRFYGLSVADARAKAEPFVLVFATPKFCTSGQCGPTLDRVKPLLDEFPSVAFINVEPYKLAFANGQLQPVLDTSGALQPVQAVNDWGIVSEPWIFVVDRIGTITASFEGVVGTDELRAAVAAVK